MFKFTLTIATSAFLFMSGAADLFAMDPLEHESKALTTKHIPEEVIGLIFEEVSKNINPLHLASVCMDWYIMMLNAETLPLRQNRSYWITNQRLHLTYSKMKPLMKNCMNTYWEGRFYNGGLAYRRTLGGEGCKFSDLNENEAFYLSYGKDTGQDVIITTSADRFFKIAEENNGEIVIGIMLRHKIGQEIKNLQDDHLFASVMEDWDAYEAPVGIFWRDGDETDRTKVDRLTVCGLGSLSTLNLYKLWVHAQRSRGSNSVLRDQDVLDKQKAWQNWSLFF